MPACGFPSRVLPGAKRGEGGIRTLGSLLGYGALAKRCFQPLSHLTKIVATALWAVSGRATDASGEYRREFLIANTDLRRVLAISSELPIRYCN